MYSALSIVIFRDSVEGNFALYATPHPFRCKECNSFPKGFGYHAKQYFHITVRNKSREKTGNSILSIV